MNLSSPAITLICKIGLYEISSYGVFPILASTIDDLYITPHIAHDL